MLRGVNRYIIEINQPESKYFDKVQFFVKPQFSEKDEEAIKEEGKRIAQESDLLKFAENKDKKPQKIGLYRALYIFGGIIIGAALTFIAKIF